MPSKAWLAATPSKCMWRWSSRCEQLTKCYVYKPGRTLYNSGVGHVSVLGANTSTQLTSPGHVLLDSRTAHWKVSWANACNFRSAYMIFTYSSCNQTGLQLWLANKNMENMQALLSLFFSQNLVEVRTGFCAMIQTLQEKKKVGKVTDWWGWWLENMGKSMATKWNPCNQETHLSLNGGCQAQPLMLPLVSDASSSPAR